MENKKLKLVLFTLTTIILAVSFLLGAEFFYFKGNNTKSTEIEVKKGESLKEIARNLSEERVINNPFLFSLYVKLLRKDKDLKSGFYVFLSRMTISQVAEKIISGETEKERITFPEGWASEKMAEKLEKEKICKSSEFEKVVRDNPEEILSDYPQLTSLLQNEKIDSLEGFLFPDTYYLEKRENADDVVKKMVSNFSRKISGNILKDIKTQKRSFYDILKIASLLEKEVRSYDDKRVVSGILWKRLDNGIALQVDATISYITGKKTTKFYAEDLQTDSPYNTYRYKGLPPTPICNPGIDSIKAALYPRSSEYWYYLSTPEGKTIFSRTFQEHKKAKFKYLK